MKNFKQWLPFILLLVVSQCAGPTPESAILGTPETGSGPAVIFDLMAHPLPDIPLPNNVATRLDEKSNTGRFLNISKIAPTFLESDLREKAGNLDGFGGYMPITVAFTKPLDLQNIVARHRDNDTLIDDALYLIDIDPNSDEQGKLWPVDIGSGNFPIHIETRTKYFENDDRLACSNLVLETTTEDLNGNGELDVGEDTDWDGQLDKPNYLDPLATPESFLPEGFSVDEPLCPDKDGGDLIHGSELIAYDNLATFWEEESNTLIVRPLLPLRPGTLYAVVLTNRLVGRDGQAVRSPWPAKHHATQASDLNTLPSLLGAYGLGTDDVAFAWTYTIGTHTRELEWIRAGLYGHGKMSYLKDAYPTADFQLREVSTREQKFYALGSDFVEALKVLVIEVADSAPAQAAILGDAETVGGVAMGSFIAPNFLVDRDGIATSDYPADDDEIFEIDPVTGEAVVGETEVTWWCLFPKRTEAHGDKPFQLSILGHGYTSSRVEALAFAGRMTRFGMALCALDAYGHGFDTSGGIGELIKLVFDASPLKPFGEGLLEGRARDLNNDGVADSGGDFWTADIFHTRDIVRQTIVDHMQFVRMVRSFDGTQTWAYDTDGDGQDDLAGDFDGDGIVDIGGDGERYSILGGSLGGIISALFSGIEPAIVTAAPVAGGAGLMDIGVRSRQGGVPEAVLLPLIGPFVVGNPVEDGDGVALKFMVNSVNKARKHPFAVLEDAVPGDRVEVINLDSGEMAHAVVPDDRRFRIAIPADALTATERRPVLGLDEEGVVPPVAPDSTLDLGDPLEIRVLDADGIEKSKVNTFEIAVEYYGTLYSVDAPLVAIAKGLGLKRNSSDMRRMMGLSQMLLEPGDPVTYAPYYDDPLDFSYDTGVVPGANVLNIPTAGDMNVPVNAGIAISRAAGIIELHEANPDYAGTPLAGMTENRALVVTHTNEAIECLPRWRTAEGKSVLFDIDDLDFGLDPFGEPGMATAYGAPPLRITKASKVEGGGFQAMRMPLVEAGGTHGFGTPEPNIAFDIHNYMLNVVGLYFWTQGHDLGDDPCLEKSSCTVEENGFALPFAQSDWEAKDWNAPEVDPDADPGVEPGNGDDESGSNDNSGS